MSEGALHFETSPEGWDELVKLREDLGPHPQGFADSLPLSEALRQLDEAIAADDQ